MTAAHVVVVGSINVDLVALVDHIPPDACGGDSFRHLVGVGASVGRELEFQGCDGDV